MTEPTEIITPSVEPSPLPPPLPTAPTGAIEQRRKRFVLIFLAGAAYGSGILFRIGAERLSGNVMAISFGLGAAVWCHYDAVQRGYELRVWLRILVLIVAGIGLPVYAFITRGWKGFILLGQALLVVAALVAIFLSSVTLMDWPFALG